MLVEGNGFAATSVDQILVEARISKGAFFHHFESKKALARALVERYVDVDLALLSQGLDSVANVEETHRSGVLPTEPRTDRWSGLADGPREHLLQGSQGRCGYGLPTEAPGGPRVVESHGAERTSWA